MCANTVASLVSVWVGGSSEGCCLRAKRQSLASMCLHQPMMMGLFAGSKTVTSVFVNRTLQSKPQMRLRPIRVCLKVGTTWPMVEKDWVSWGMADLAVKCYPNMCPLAMPTCTLGAVGLDLEMGASGE